MWKSACVGIHQLLNWKMHCETLKLKKKYGINVICDDTKFILNFIKIGKMV